MGKVTDKPRTIYDMGGICLLSSVRNCLKRKRKEDVNC